MSCDDRKELDEKKLKLMKISILQLERTNLNTREKSDRDMGDAVRKTIISIADMVE